MVHGPCAVTSVCQLQLSLHKLHDFGEVLHASNAILDGRSAAEVGRVYFCVFQSNSNVS